MKPKIGVIVSTTRPTRAGLGVAEWFVDQVKDMPEMDFELIDLKEVDLPLLSEPESASSGNYTQDKVKAWSKRIADFDGFVIVMAEYNNGYPAPLKNAFDTLYHEWSQKPVAFVGYGTYAASRAIDHMVAVVAKVNAMPITSTVIGVVKPWEAMDEKGWPKAEYVMGNMAHFVDNLRWWATTLKAARKQ